MNLRFLGGLLYQFGVVCLAPAERQHAMCGTMHPVVSSELHRLRSEPHCSVWLNGNAAGLHLADDEGFQNQAEFGVAGNLERADGRKKGTIVRHAEHAGVSVTVKAFPLPVDHRRRLLKSSSQRHFDRGVSTRATPRMLYRNFIPAPCSRR